MAGTIWLIVEGQNDGEIVEAILSRQFPHVLVESLFPFGKNPNLSRLAAQVERLIKQALDKRKSGDCIAVLHDADLLSQSHNRADYDRIRKICNRYRKDVRLVIARDEIEAWLLADEGFCAWLKIKAQNCDEMRQPSVYLASRLDKTGKSKYSLAKLSKFLSYVNGVTSSPTLHRELEYLSSTPCVRGGGQ